ncbi:MAG: chemotaxis protein CheW [Dethiobacteria bacterium]|jgi:purine-binding chemotaxis protein CheW
MVLKEQTGDSALGVQDWQSKSSTENQYVTFWIGTEEYGIDIMLVQEIIRYKKPTRVFNSNPVISGVINFRGKVIPVIDMHRKFDLQSGQKYDEFTVIIVIEVNKKTMGMIVDRVSDIMSFHAENIQLVDREFADDIRSEHLKGMAKSAERIILLLDPERVLSFEELKQVKEIAAKHDGVKEALEN